MLTQETRSLINHIRSNRKPSEFNSDPSYVLEDIIFEQDDVRLSSFKDFCAEDPLDTTIRETVDTGHSFMPDYCPVCSMFNEDELPREASEAAQEAEKKRKKTAQPRIAKMFKHYGPADEKPASETELKNRVSKRFDELAAMSPHQRRKEYQETSARRKSIGLNTSAFRSNKKTDTAAIIPTPTAPKGHIPLGMSFTPDTARHYTKPDLSSHVDRNTCAGSTVGCRASCLAKHGNYEFATVRGHMDVLTHSLTHNEKATRDHATHVFQQLEHHSNKAAKEGKQVLTRYSVTDDTGANIHSEATAKHFPNVVQMGYTKRHNTPHDPSKGIHTIFSDTGPVVSHDGKIHEENFKRRAVLHAATTQRGMPTYMVFNRRRPGAKHGPEHPISQEYHNTMNNLHTVRRYELHPSEPKPGEAAEFHHPDGHGRVVSKLTGKSHRYQDHPVADKIKTVTGEMIHPSQHDARNADTFSRVFKNPEGKPVGHVVPAFATTSTSRKNLKSAFFHRVENIKDGIYHDAHPDEVHAAKQKNQLNES